MSYPRLIQLTIAQIVGILLKKKIEMINIRVTESVSFGTDKLPLLILPNRHLRYSTLDILKIVQIMWLKRKRRRQVQRLLYFLLYLSYFLWQFSHIGYGKGMSWKRCLIRAAWLLVMICGVLWINGTVHKMIIAIKPINHKIVCLTATENID